MLQDLSGGGSRGKGSVRVGGACRGRGRAGNIASFLFKDQRITSQH